MNSEQRIQKILAQNGLASRRTIEKWIAMGSITINEQQAQLGQKIGAQDVVKVNGQAIELNFARPLIEILMYHKPLGEICGYQDAQGRPCVMPKLNPHKRKWVNVGRLDVNSSGLLLLTNSGELAHHLMHPKFNHLRKYWVKVLGDLKKTDLDKLRKGIQLSDGFSRFESIEILNEKSANKHLHVTLKSGKNREVRRLFQAIDLEVSKLKRIEYAGIRLPCDLKAGQSRLLSAPRVKKLCQAAQFSNCQN